MKGGIRGLSRVFYGAARVTFSLLVAAWRVAFGAGRAAGSVSLFAYDVVRSRRIAGCGHLRCPRGHEIELDGGVYECARCSFRYAGSILLCGNPECGASSSYVDCPDCGLSVRNPFRSGRP